MKRAIIGELKNSTVTSKLTLQTQPLLFFAIKDITSGNFIYFCNHKSELELLADHEVPKWYQVVWSQDLFMSDESFKAIWDYCISNLGERMPDDQLYKLLQSVLKKDNRQTHFVSLRTIEDLRNFYQKLK